MEEMRVPRIDFHSRVNNGDFKAKRKSTGLRTRHSR